MRGAGWSLYGVRTLLHGQSAVSEPQTALGHRLVCSSDSQKIPTASGPLPLGLFIRWSHWAALESGI